MPVYSQISQSSQNVTLRLLSNSTKIKKPPELRRDKTYERISKKENGLIIISALDVTEKKTSCR